MDLSSLPLPSPEIQWPALQQWLKQTQQTLTAESAPADRARWLNALDSHRPSLGPESAEIYDWLAKHELLDPSGHGLSMAGVGVVLASTHPRLARSEAWDEAAKLLARVDWINRADPRLVSMRVADVLLFGSMTDPAKPNHGDLDAVLILEPVGSSSEGAPSREAVFKAAGWTFDRLPSGLPSFRRLMETQLTDTAGFCALTSRADTLETLLNQDVDFSCYSLLGKAWTPQALAHTTADEEAYVVMQALDNGVGHPARRAHIARELTAARARLDLNEPSVAASLVQASASQAPSDQDLWWASLQPTGAPALLAHLQAARVETASVIAQVQAQLGNALPDRVADWSIPIAARPVSPSSLKAPAP